MVYDCVFKVCLFKQEAKQYYKDFNGFTRVLYFGDYHVVGLKSHIT